MKEKRRDYCTHQIEREVIHGGHGHTHTDRSQGNLQLPRQFHPVYDVLEHHHHGRREDFHELIEAHTVVLQGEVIEDDKTAEGERDGEDIRM